LDEAGLQASLFGERLGPADRRSGEIQASDPGSQPGPVERVEAEVALQVKQVEAGHVTAQRQLGGPQRAGAGEEARDVVVAVLAVHRCPLVPVPDIEPASLLQRAKTGSSVMTTACQPTIGLVAVVDRSMDSELGDIVAGRRHVDPSFFCRKIRLLGRGRLGGTYSYGPSRESCDERVEDVLVVELCSLGRRDRQR